MHNFHFKKLVLFFFLIFLGLLSACAKAVHPVSSLSPESFFSIKEKLQALPNRKIQHLSGLAQVSLEGHGRHESFDIALKIEAPDRLEIQVMDDLGQVQSSLKADGAEVFWQDFVSRDTRRFPQNADVFQKTWGLPLTVEAFIAAMLGHLDPEEAIEQVEALAREQSHALLQIDRVDDRVVLQADTNLLQSYSLRKKPRSKHWNYRVEYRDYRPQDGYEFPQEIQWNFRKPKISVLMHWSDVKLKEY